MADMEPENRVPLLVGQLEEARSYREEELKGDEVGVESLDYEPIHSLVYAQTKKGSQQRHFYGYDTLSILHFEFYDPRHCSVMFMDVNFRLPQNS